jgi:hypothetical protein
MAYRTNDFSLFEDCVTIFRSLTGAMYEYRVAIQTLRWREAHAFDKTLSAPEIETVYQTNGWLDVPIPLTKLTRIRYKDLFASIEMLLV